MKNPTEMKMRMPIRSLAFLTVLTLASSTQTRAEWFVEAGPFYRGQMKISVEGGSRAGDSGGDASVAGTRGGTVLPSGILLNDDGTAADFRAFDNGYVGPSDWAWARDGGVTQYFAYETPGQYDAGANTLRFNRTLTGTSGTATRTTTRVADSGSSGWNDSTRTNGVGIMAALGYQLRTRPTAEEVEAGEEENRHELSLLFRFGWLEGMGADFRNRPAYQQDVSSRRLTSSIASTEVHQYTYDTLGNPFFPAAPYTMSDPGGVGPMIADTPDSIALLPRTDALTENAAAGPGGRRESLVDLDLDVEAFTFQFGPRWVWGPKESVSLFLQPLATLNLIDASADRQESFRDADGRQLGSWQDQADDQSWRWGGGIQLGVQASLTENWFLNGSGGYDWVKSTHLDVGPDRVRIDISGYQLELALGRRF